MPSTESGRLEALRRSHQYVKVEEEEETGSVALTLADALALLDAPQGAVLYLASWHKEVALATSAKTLGFDVVTCVPLFFNVCASVPITICLSSSWPHLYKLLFFG